MSAADTIPAVRDADDLAYWAWTILANVSEGRWEDQTPEWQEAVVRWRDAFHASLHEPRPSRVARIVGWFTALPHRQRRRDDEALLLQAREALRLTREYVMPDTRLPCVPGWSWWDACVAIDDRLGLTHDDLTAYP